MLLATCKSKCQCQLWELSCDYLRVSLSMQLFGELLGGARYSAMLDTVGLPMTLTWVNTTVHKVQVHILRPMWSANYPVVATRISLLTPAVAPAELRRVYRAHN